MAHKPVQRFILVGLTLLVLLNGSGLFLLTWMQAGYHRTFGLVTTNFENEHSDNTLPKQPKQPIPVFPVFPLIGTTAILPLFSGDTIAFNETQCPALDTPALIRCSPPPELV
jgi:hypothetical protein